MFGYVPSWFLNWEYRKQVIIHEILSYDADIVCLQEVSSSQFEQYFKPQLRMRGGYEGFFNPKSRSKTMSEWDRQFVDGCATFFKADKFKVMEKTLVEFNQMALSRPSLRKHRDMYNRVMTRDNIALIIRLEHKASRQEIVVANAHIHWDPSFRDVKLIQSIILLEELEKQLSHCPKAALIVCGDFNSLPGSGVCTLLEDGRIPPDHADFQEFNYEPYTSQGASHSLNLKNAYADLSLNFTSLTPTFMGVIDYIWFCPNKLKVAGCLGPVPFDYVKQIVGLPSEHLPSDHISLLVEFKVEPSTTAKAAGGIVTMPSSPVITTRFTGHYRNFSTSLTTNSAATNRLSNNKNT
jgi:CCR4-NOT transcription complex subunit 6